MKSRLALRALQTDGQADEQGRWQANERESYSLWSTTGKMLQFWLCDNNAPVPTWLGWSHTDTNVRCTVLSNDDYDIKYDATVFPRAGVDVGDLAVSLLVLFAAAGISHDELEPTDKGGLRFMFWLE